MPSRPEQVFQRIAQISERDRILIAAHLGQDLDMSDQVDKIHALLDAVRALEAAAIPYALIGGIAVGLHTGVPRATIDIDLAVPAAHRGQTVIGALTSAGFKLLGEHAHSFNFHHSSGEPLQLAFDLQFDAMIDRASEIQVAGHAIRLISKDDLIVMKRRAAADPGRRRSKALRDLADVEMLLGDVQGENEGW